MSAPIIEINAQGIERELARMQSALSAIGGKQADKVLANAINQSLAEGRKEAAKIARREYTAPVKKLFDNINLLRARGANPEGRIELFGKPGVSLIHFKTQPNRPTRPAGGVTAQVKRKGARRVWNGAGGPSFVMKKKQGGFGVFARNAGKKLEMLLGPSPVQALQRKDTQEQVSKKVEEAFGPRLEAEIDRALARLGSGR